MIRLSLIVPVLNEEKILPHFLDHLEKFSAIETVIVDGGSDDRTEEILAEWSAGASERSPRVVLSSRKGRARQMNEGAKRATGDPLLFLHADSLLDPKGLDSILNVLSDAAVVAGAFRLQIDSPFLFLRLIERMAHWRSSLLKLPYGDQGIFVRREIFERLGGYAELPLMEDVDFIRRLKKTGKVVLLKETATTSARRWKKRGYFFTSFRNLVLITLYYLGFSPERLAKWYD